MRWLLQAFRSGRALRDQGGVLRGARDHFAERIADRGLASTVFAARTADLAQDALERARLLR